MLSGDGMDDDTTNLAEQARQLRAAALEQPDPSRAADLEARARVCEALHRKGLSGPVEIHGCYRGGLNPWAQ